MNQVYKTITIKKLEDVTGRYWIFLNSKDEEVFSLCRRIDKDDNEGGYLYEEAVAVAKKKYSAEEIIFGGTLT